MVRKYLFAEAVLIKYGIGHVSNDICNFTSFFSGMWFIYLINNTEHRPHSSFMTKFDQLD